MDTIGTEVGQKMRSAVKAKLIELGTGYIDDELPDYVMIMVANKRSKQQMKEDLNLFLGSNTDPFVSWLHQVLQKLQEVTLPPTNPSTSSSGTAKRKTSTSDGTEKKKKDKKLKRSHKGKSMETIEPQSKPSTPPPPSITDVFADHLIQKAKSTLILENAVTVKTKSEETTNKDSAEKKSSDDFDIPTITEIAENEVVKVNRRKELSDLAELQKQINKAKRHLRSLGSEESEDEDFINIKDDDDLGEDDDDALNKKRSLNSSATTKVGDKLPSSRSQRVQIIFNENQSKDERGSQPLTGARTKKISIMERLGVKPTSFVNRDNVVSLSANRRVEQEIYVPAFRRKDDDKRTKVPLHDREPVKDLRSRELSRGLIDREKSREMVRDLRERVGRSKIVEENVIESTVKLTAKQRIGSRVIVPPPKPEYEDTVIEVPVNSVIRVKPRPIFPANKQASKNLLLKAVAEAQKSTAMIKPRPESPPMSLQNATGRSQKLFTKSFRDNRMGKGKKNIVIEVTQKSDEKANADDDFIEVDDEYVTAMISDVEDFEEDEELAYTPVEINASDEEMKSNYTYQPSSEEQTKFVVTLNTDRDKYMPSSKPRIKSIDRKRVEINGASQPEKIIKRPVAAVMQKENKRTSSPLRLDMTTQKVNKLIIKNDTEDEEELRKEVERSTSRKRNRLSPIKFDLNDEKRTKTREDQTDEDMTANAEENQRVTIKRSDVSRKYDNLPAFLNTINLADKTKSKDRCKFYPSCGKGDSCEFVHPSSPCKVFPNCKFGDKCLYIHPKCKFDLTCTRLGCNFSHTTIISAAPPLSSHVVPVMNYKSIGTNVLSTQCKFYPKCSNTSCQFYHPKPCHFGKNCANKLECNFYHFDTAINAPVNNKLKWVASEY